MIRYFLLLLLIFPSLSFSGASSFGVLPGQPGGGGGDVTSSASITAEQPVCGDNGAKGIKDCTHVAVDADGKEVHTGTLDDATGNEVALQLDYTTNKATSGDDTGLVINKTDILSPGTSKLLEFMLGGVSQAYFTDIGSLSLLNNGSASALSLMLGGGTKGFYSVNDTSIGVGVASGLRFQFKQTEFASAFAAKFRNSNPSDTNPVFTLAADDTGVGGTATSVAIIVGGATVLKAESGVVDISGYVSQDVCHGEIYEDGAGSVITITTAGTFYPWVTSTVGSESGNGFVDCDATTDDCTIESATCAGLYRASGSMSFSGTNGADVHCALFVDDVKQDNVSLQRTLGVAATIGSASANGLLNLANGEVVDFQCTSDDNGDTVTVYHANMTLVKVN